LRDRSENLAKAADRPARLGEQLSTFVEWVKPYKEIAVLLVGLFSAISVGIAWTVNHFATQNALSDLECRIRLAMTTASKRWPMERQRLRLQLDYDMLN
jgi:hypothetical protein